LRWGRHLSGAIKLQEELWHPDIRRNLCLTESANSGIWYSTPVGGGIIHRRIDVRVGKGQFDVIRVHRVVMNNLQKGVDAVMVLPGLFSSRLCINLEFIKHAV
jgi:hypothetical protein